MPDCDAQSAEGLGSPAELILLANSEPGSDRVSAVARSRAIDPTRGPLWRRLECLLPPNSNSPAVSELMKPEPGPPSRSTGPHLLPSFGKMPLRRSLARRSPSSPGARAGRGRGYAGSRALVDGYASFLRTGIPPPKTNPPSPAAAPAAQPLAPREIVWRLLRVAGEPAEPERQYLDDIRQADPVLATAVDLTRGFVAMARGRQPGVESVRPPPGECHRHRGVPGVGGLAGPRPGAGATGRTPRRRRAGPAAHHPTEQIHAPPFRAPVGALWYAPE
jgi:hypothetical protein